MCTILVLFSVISATVASADPAVTPTTIRPDPPPRSGPPIVGPANFIPSWNLDGIYFWLGPTGTVAVVDGDGDTAIGASAAVVRVREGAALGTLGVSAGATLWTERDGGRIWLDGMIGTRLGRMVGISAGPLLALAELNHPRVGGSIGVWAFLGVTPYARVGVIDKLGGFAEVGLHIAFPIIRR